MTNQRANSISRHRWRPACLAILLGSILLSTTAQGATVFLTLDIFEGLYKFDGTTELEIGSTFYLIASAVDTPSTPQPFGDGLIANSVSSNEVLVATLFLNGADLFEDPPVAGDHYQQLTLDASIFDGMNHLYVRFFDYTEGARVVGSNIFWGTTSSIELTFGGDDPNLLLVDAFFDGVNAATNENTFVAIPEPGTFGLVALAGLGLAALGRRNARAKLLAESKPLSDAKL
jgi:hypothetical protein